VPIAVKTAVKGQSVQATASVLAQTITQAQAKGVASDLHRTQTLPAKPTAAGGKDKDTKSTVLEKEKSKIATANQAAAVAAAAAGKGKSATLTLDSHVASSASAVPVSAPLKTTFKNEEGAGNRLRFIGSDVEG